MFSDNAIFDILRKFQNNTVDTLKWEDHVTLGAMNYRCVALMIEIEKVTANKSAMGYFFFLSFFQKKSSKITTNLKFLKKNYPKVRISL